jgi:hypothetical protein
MTDQQLEDMIVFPGIPPAVPLHSQSVERAVKMTSEASTTSYSWAKGHENIVTVCASRKQRKRFPSKKGYIK